MLTDAQREVIRACCKDRAAYERIIALLDRVYLDNTTFQFIAAHLNDIVFLYDLDWNIQFVTPAFEALTGYTPDKAGAQKFQHFVHPDDLTGIEQVRDRIASGLGAVDHEFRIKVLGGDYRWVACSCRAITDEAGVVIATLGRAVDITNRHATVEKLRADQRFMHRLINTIPDVIYVFDLEQQANVYVNREIADVLGYTPEEVREMGSNMMGYLLHPDDLQQMTTFYSRHGDLKDDDVIELEYRMRNKAGEWRWLYSREMIFERGATGAPSQILGIAQDITGRKQYEAEAREHARTQSLSQMKSRMMMRISHEFRTPLSIINASSEILERYSDRLTGEHKIEHLHRIQQQVHHLADIIEQLDFVLGSESGKNMLAVSHFDLVAFCREIIVFVERFGNKDHHFRLDLTAEALMVTADRALLGTALRLLLTNARDYSPAGSEIVLAATAEADTIRLSVSDSGIGIPPDDLPNVFEPFYRASNVGDIDGVGLGLAIAYDIIRQHHGSITIENRAAGGTCVSMHLPQ